jgi:MFS family permease
MNASPRAFDALRLPGFRAFVGTFFLTMMADTIEHVISYWVVFQKFHSVALGGFAVVSHWLPYLLLSVHVGMVADRRDSRRISQAGNLLFMLVSVGWGLTFFLPNPPMWTAMALLVLHGCSGVFWGTASQMILYDIVGPAKLASAVRLNATARTLGMLLGPAVGSVMLRVLGPKLGIFVNALLYVPAIAWLYRAPAPRRTDAPIQRVRGLADITQTLRDVRAVPVLLPIIVLAGAASFFVGNSYQAQMPGFAVGLGHGDPGLAYSVLLGADAGGALVGSIALEVRGSVFVASARTATKLAAFWASTLAGFALTRNYSVAVTLLFLAGFFELAFASTTQTLVQMNAPNAIRGRVLGLYNMSVAGLRTFSGVTVGLVGSVLDVRSSLAVAGGMVVVVSIATFFRMPAEGP